MGKFNKKDRILFLMVLAGIILLFQSYINVRHVNVTPGTEHNQCKYGPSYSPFLKYRVIFSTSYLPFKQISIYIVSE